MSGPLPHHPGTEPTGARSGGRTLGVWPMLAIMTAIWMVLSLYTNERVLTPQVLAHLAPQGSGMAMTAGQMDDLQRLELLSYALLPLLLTLRTALTALVLQLFTVLLSAEIGYRDLFRASLWGFGAVMYGMFIQTLRLDLMGPDLTMSELSVVPDSLAALILNPAPTLTMGYSALSLLNLHSLLWIGILFTYFRFECRFTPRRALLVPLASWATISLTQLGLQTFAAQILG